LTCGPNYTASPDKMVIELQKNMLAPGASRNFTWGTIPLRDAILHAHSLDARKRPTGRFRNHGVWRRRETREQGGDSSVNCSPTM
jgi:hypothetical protein